MSQSSKTRNNNFIKFNDLTKQQQNQQNLNGHLVDNRNPITGHPQPSSPLIGKNYPHQRVTKSSSSSNESKSLIDQHNLSTINNNINHHKQNSFDLNNHPCISSSVKLNSPSQQRHSFRGITTNNNNNQLQLKQHTYDNVNNNNNHKSDQELSPKFMRKNFLRNSLSNNNQQQSTYGQIIGANSSNSSNSKLRNNNDDKNNNNIIVNDCHDDGNNTNHHRKQSFDWIEIFEPKSRAKMFANLTTGECSWLEPKGVTILRQSDPKITQWWELYDQKSKRFYYYSVKDSRTIWRKPDSVDAIVVPLAKLQIIKQQSTNETNSSPLERILSSSSSVSSSPSSSTASQRLAIMASINSNICLACRQQTSKKMVDSSTQTSSSDMFCNTNRPMVSRWTQTTSQTPIDIRRLPDLLSDDYPGHTPQTHQRVQPSLRHYLLSEARFAARGQTVGLIHSQNVNDNRIYDPIAPESIYDPVTNIDDEEFILNEDYCNYYDDFEDDPSDLDEDDELSFDSCDADDEFGDDNSFTEAEDVGNDDESLDFDVSHYRKNSSSDSHLVDEDIYHDDRVKRISQSNGKSVNDYDTVYNGQSQFEPTVANNREADDSNDGPIRMSASFTANDFKRNSVSRSSFSSAQPHLFRPSLSNVVNNNDDVDHNQHHPPKQKQSELKNSKFVYSNPFNDHDNSLPNNSALIEMDQSAHVSNNENIKGLVSIADRIQLFNQKSSKKTTMIMPTSPKSVHRQKSMAAVSFESTQHNSTRKSLQRSATTETDRSAVVVDNQVQRFLHQQQIANKICMPTAVTQDQTSFVVVPSKSTSMTLISPPTTVIQSSDPLSNEKRSSLTGKFSTKIINASSNQLDLSKEIPRNESSASLSPSHTHLSLTSSKPVAPSYPIPPPHLHHGSISFNQAMIINQAASNSSMTTKNVKNKPKSNKNKHMNVNLEKKDQNTINDGKSTKKSIKSNATISKEKTLLNGNNSIESFARECVSRHRKGGIFSKKKTLKSMLTHTKKPLKKPMISTISDATLVKESVLCFKMIQIFMGDRPASPALTQNSMTNDTTGPSGERISPIPSNSDKLLMNLINICVSLVPLRDEVLVQVARQVTQNPNPESERRGLELMCTLFWYFTASNKLAQHLHAFLQGHRNTFTTVVRRKFEQQLHRSRYTHSHLFYRKPHSDEEVARVLRAVHCRHVGIFGESLYDAVIESSELPWPVVLLTEALLEPRHDDREGVFRCVGDMDDVHRLKMKLDTILPTDRDFKQKIGMSYDGGSKTNGQRKITDEHDIHVIASTLKLYFRELRESIIPSHMYHEALDCAHDPERACKLLDKLDPLNYSTMRYLIHFLQIFSTNEYVRYTKMDDANLSMVWAPNILRSPAAQNHQQQQFSGPEAAKAAMINSANIYEHTRAEMSFVRTLIQHLQT